MERPQLVKLLLDTHIWVWSLLQPEKMVPRLRRALEDPANEKWLSPISVWELVILVDKKRVSLNVGIDKWVAQSLAIAPLREAPLTTEVALATRETRRSHRDPADAFLVATAKVFELTLVTSDAHLVTAKGISVLRNR
ncbi:MAG: PIN domain nuclease [Acidobacteria bacterium]|nr:MAG: PIN domain nuclease [Acidobacteriota bacterium]